MKITLFRNATLLVETEDLIILVDPMFSSKGQLGPFPYLDDLRNNPLTDLPFDREMLYEYINKTDLVIITHLHPDHIDPLAVDLLSFDIPVVCQPGDALSLRQLGFKRVHEIIQSANIQKLGLIRTNGNHGIGEIGEIMGKVSGFVLLAEGLKIYIMGDTIWCREVELALIEHKPDVIIVNGGAAQFSMGGPVTFSMKDLERIIRILPDSRIFVVHLEAVSPMTETRADTIRYLAERGLSDHIGVPADGETFFEKFLIPNEASV